jgi:hypothetical protein
MNMQQRKALAWGLVGLVPVVGISAYAQGAVTPEYRWLTFTVFAAIITLTMYVTYVASKRVKSASDFYTAGGGVTGLQNGWAIAGDYLSAASFLGIAGLISQYGYDGFMYSVGWLVAYITVLLVIAEPCRNIGRYTLSDILAYRNNPKAMRIVGALSVITVSTFYLTAQMVGGGVLVKTLIGIDYEVSVIAVGVLMLAYVLFGGMVATTWVQIIKAILLVIASLVLVVMVWLPYGFSLPGFLADVTESSGACRLAAGRSGEGDVGGRTRPAIPRAGPVFQGADRPDLARHGAGVRHGRTAAHPDAFLHRADRAAGAQVGGVGDGHHRRFLRADAVPGLRRGQAGRPGCDCRRRSGRQHGGPAARAVPGRWPEFVPRQLHAGFRLRRRVRDDRGRGRGTGAGCRIGHRA